MISEKPIYGMEEEVFVTEPEKPSLKSLYYLARLLKKDIGFYYTHTASNFSRGKDVRQGLMSGVEISTDIHSDVSSLIDDFTRRRDDLISFCEGLIVPLGHLINYCTPTNTCAFQIHVGGIKDKTRAYNNLVHFLPLLALLTMNSPGTCGGYFGQSFRIAKSFAIGELRDDWKYRFQDIIYAKRLGTIELRIFDPTWDLSRIRLLLNLIDAIVKAEKHYPLDKELYNKIRPKIVLTGFCEELKEPLAELKELLEMDDEFFRATCSDKVWRFFEKEGLINTYSAMDNAYRTGNFAPARMPEKGQDLLKISLGFGGYFIPKLPYVLWKYWREW